MPLLKTNKIEMLDGLQCSSIILAEFICTILYTDFFNGAYPTHTSNTVSPVPSLAAVTINKRTTDDFQITK